MGTQEGCWGLGLTGFGGFAGLERIGEDEGGLAVQRGFYGLRASVFCCISFWVGG